MRIGIITNAYEAPRVRPLANYLESRGAHVAWYVEEERVADSAGLPFNEDAFFVKGKGYVLVELARLAQEYGDEVGAPVVNSPRAIWNAAHRFVYCLLCRRAGVPVPAFSVARAEDARFDRFIAKNLIDQNHLRALDAFPVVGRPGDPIPDLNTGEEAGRDSIVPRFHLVQEYVESEYEYKVYVFGPKFFFYRQVPVLVNPHKMETRVPVPEDPELRSLAAAAVGALGLEVASVDFLKPEGRGYLLTDINSIPNFNYVEHGPGVLGEYLLSRAAGRGRRSA
ncbi:MAG: hypothetical protein Kow0069_35200 [Promethearchaeota archaeon]